MSLYSNDGTGWAFLGDADVEGYGGRSDLGLSGFSGGDVVVYRDACGITLFSRDGSSQCTWSQPIDADFGVKHVMTVDSASAGYALAGNQVLEYGVSQWNLLATLPVEPVFGASALWADSNSVLVVGQRQFAVRGDANGVFESLPSVPAGDYTAVWAFDAEVWLANTVGHLVRFDGQRWTTNDTGMSAPIYGLWGSADGVLYFYGQQDFGRWSGGAVERFAIADGSPYIHFAGMWGNHTNEVFLSVIDNSFRDYQCSGAFMVFFDGAEFHLF